MYDDYLDDLELSRAFDDSEEDLRAYELIATKSNDDCSYENKV